VTDPVMRELAALRAQQAAIVDMLADLGAALQIIASALTGEPAAAPPEDPIAAGFERFQAKRKGSR
jgi:hypothetical protein